MLRTYSNLRYGLAVISFVFAPFLWLIGWLWHAIDWQDSMSAYYFIQSSDRGTIPIWLANRNIPMINSFLSVLDGLDNITPMRTWFVGALFVLGIFLYLYKGYSWPENYLLNVAGLCALGVALFPMEWNCPPTCNEYPSHAVFAAGGFISMAIVGLFFSHKSLREMPPVNPMRKNIYHGLYYVFGGIMAAFPFIAWYQMPQWFKPGGRGIFYVEWAGLSAFALYWWIKSNELSETGAEQLAIATDLPIPSVTVEQVRTALLNVGASKPHDEGLANGVPVRHSIIAHQAFEIASVAPKGGQFFICDTKEYGDAIYAYYDARKAQEGTYLYRSPSGGVVVQLNSGLNPDEAAKFEAAVRTLP